MPRIEIVPHNWKESCECKAGDGTPTIDVCHSCSFDFEEGEELPLSLQDRFKGATVGSTDVAHPPYDDSAWDEGCPCDCCGDKLEEKDD